jgi:hypothetical protein
MKNYTTIIIFFIGLIGFSQDKYEKGYFIDNSGTKTDCFIKNIDLQYNPTSIEYKSSLDESSKTVTISNLQELSIEGESKYIRKTLEIDNSKGEPNYSNKKEPNFISLTVLLKVLVEGKNSLYSYENNEFPIRFFYKTDKTEVKQLIYKKYFDENQTDLYANTDYKKQLFIDVKADETNSKIENLPFKQNDLINYFTIANAFQGDTNSKEIQKRKDTKINFKFVLNSNFSNFDFKFSDGVPFDGKNTTEKKLSFGYGFEIEMNLNNNKNWTVFIEPSYNSYSGEGTFTSTYYINPNYTNGNVNENYKASVKYSYFQLPFGIKKNINLNKKSKLNIQTAAILQFSGSSNLKLLRADNSTYLDTNLNGNKFNLLFGIGYSFNKFEIDLRQYTNVNVNPSLNNSSYSYQNLSLSLKYKINK